MSFTRGLALAIVGMIFAVPASGQLPKPLKESEVKAADGRQVPAAELRQKLIGNTAYHLFLRDTTYQCVLPEGDCIVSLRYAPGNSEGL